MEDINNIIETSIQRIISDSQCLDFDEKKVGHLLVYRDNRTDDDLCLDVKTNEFESFCYDSFQASNYTDVNGLKMGENSYTYLGGGVYFTPNKNDIVIRFFNKLDNDFCKDLVTEHLSKKSINSSVISPF